MAAMDSIHADVAEDKVLRDLADQVKNETPRITDAVKNFMSLLIAKSFTDTDFNAAIITACSKTLLFEAQRFVLPTIEEFLVKHPQGADQTGEERIDEVCRYKVIYALREQLKATQDQKISKFFGKSFFKWSKCWPELRQSVESNLMRDQNISEEYVTLFLNMFEHSIFDTNDYGDDLEDDRKLIWAADLNKELKRRQEKRIELGKQRTAATNSEDVNNINIGIDGNGTGGRVEELADDDKGDDSSSSMKSAEKM